MDSTARAIDHSPSTPFADGGRGGSGHVGSSSSAGATALHDLLTPEEKKQNHILSEKKRREGIRNGFVTLTELVPGLTPAKSKSEALVLRATIDYLDVLHDERQKLERELAELKRGSGSGGGSVAG
ncbi:Transcription factor [Savitreella phatthalungensis]